MVINEILLSSVIIITLLITLSSLSYESVNADTDFCYDQVGDGHSCFDKKGKCDNAQKDDEVAESPCFKED